jgi:hypothetical protein
VRRGRVEARPRQRLGIRDAVSFGGEELEPVEALMSSDGWITGLLDGLPSDQADAIRARVLEERDYADIAGSLQTSELVIRKRVSRGLATLRQERSRGSSNDDRASDRPCPASGRRRARDKTPPLADRRVVSRREPPLLAERAGSAHCGSRPDPDRDRGRSTAVAGAHSPTATETDSLRSTRQQLIDSLAVLRRPQTRADTRQAVLPSDAVPECPRHPFPGVDRANPRPYRFRRGIRGSIEPWSERSRFASGTPR